MMDRAIVRAFGAACLAWVAACNPPQIAGAPLKAPSAGDAFEGVQCSAVRPQTEPDLMAWDSGSRASLKALRAEGLAVVRYEARGCSVKLELLPHCIVKRPYKYTAYSSNEHKVAHNANELFAQFPVGAGSFTGKLEGGRALRTDYMLAGLYSIPPESTVTRADLEGAGCERATHVVSAIHVGGFAMVSGEQRSLDVAASVFVASTNLSQSGDAQTEFDEGNADACKDAQRSSKANEACDVPLRVGLLALDGAASTPTASAPSAAKAAPSDPAVGNVATTASAPAHIPSAGPAPGFTAFRAQGLTWQREPANHPMNWAEAKAYCAGLPGGWRLPTQGELLALFANKASLAASVPGMDDDWYWSSTPLSGSPSTAWDVYFYNGNRGTNVVSNTNRVRCVR